MRKRLALLLAVVILAGAAAMVYLKKNALEMIHAVIVNAVIQKAPEDYSEASIRSAFERRLEACTTPAEEEAYLDHLKVLSQRLEKVQAMESWEVDQILEEVVPDGED